MERTSIFTEACNLAERIPSMGLTVKFFWSLMYNALTPEDRVKLVEKLMDKVTNPEINVEVAE
jgi:hypothetical protein